MKKRLGLALLLLGAALSQAQENYKTNWTGHRVVGVGGQGSGISGNVLNFPILVRLGAADSAIFKASKLNGADLRFTKSDSVARLKHEIERWDSAGRSAVIWVKVDTVYAASTTRLLIHWGNTAAMDSSIGASVFDTANGFQGVWHMNGSTAASNETDATLNGFTATAFNDIAPGAGVIGGARVFAGGNTSNGNASGTAADNDYFRVANSATGKLAFARGSRYTLSAWVNPAVAGTHRTIISKHDRNMALKTGGGGGFEIFEYNGNRGLFTVPPRTSYSWHSIPAPTALTSSSLNQWYHVVGTRDSLGGSLYVNGVRVSTTLGNDTLAGTNTTPGYITNGTTTPLLDSVVVFGRQQESNNRYWAGSMDELRITSRVRDSNWVKLEYSNQKAGGALVALLPTDIYYVMPGVGTTPRDTMSFSTGVAVNLALKYAGGPVDSVAVTTGALPAGLTLNKTTGLLSGTPSAAFAAANQTITLYTAAGNATRGLRITVIAGPTSNLHYTADTAVYAVGIEVLNAPTWVGRAPTSFTVVPSLPAGLTLNTTTGMISGTPSAAVAVDNYVVKAKNSTDSTTVTLRLTIGAAEDLTTWGQHKDWWTNTQGNGANVLKAVRNFPVLICLDSLNFGSGFAQSIGRGSDIRFTRADNTTRLAHQIERWDSAGKKAEIWVLVDTIPGNTIRGFRMHWSKAGAINTSNGSTVFKTSNGFQGVWHMNGATATSDERDATANNLTAFQTSAPPVATGAIAGGRTFDNASGTSDFFTVTGSAAVLANPVGSSYTISAWVNLGATTAHSTLVSKHDNAYALKLDNGSNWEIFEYNAAWNSYGGPSEQGAWKHVLGVINGTDPTMSAMYIDGVRTDAGPITTASTTARNDAIDLLLGAEPQTATTRRRPYIGLADEIRIAGVARDTAWAKLEYENQKPAAQTLVAYTQPTSIGANGNASAQTLAFGLSAKAFGDGMLFRIQGAGAANIRISLTDLRGRPVWSRTVASSGTNEIVWNGTINSGMRASTGIYALRVTLLDADNKVVQTLSRKLPFTH